MRTPARPGADARSLAEMLATCETGRMERRAGGLSCRLSGLDWPAWLELSSDGRVLVQVSAPVLLSAPAGAFVEGRRVVLVRAEGAYARAALSLSDFEAAETGLRLCVEASASRPLECSFGVDRLRRLCRRVLAARTDRPVLSREHEFGAEAEGPANGWRISDVSVGEDSAATDRTERALKRLFAEGRPRGWTSSVHATGDACAVARPTPLGRRASTPLAEASAHERLEDEALLAKIASAVLKEPGGGAEAARDFLNAFGAARA